MLCRKAGWQLTHCEVSLHCTLTPTLIRLRLLLQILTFWSKILFFFLVINNFSVSVAGCTSRNCPSFFLNRLAQVLFYQITANVLISLHPHCFIFFRPIGSFDSSNSNSCGVNEMNRSYDNQSGKDFQSRNVTSHIPVDILPSKPKVPFRPTYTNKSYRGRRY